MSSGRDSLSLSINALFALAIALLAAFLGAPAWGSMALTGILFALFQIADALRDVIFVISEEEQA